MYIAMAFNIRIILLRAFGQFLGFLKVSNFWLVVYDLIPLTTFTGLQLTFRTCFSCYSFETISLETQPRS